MEVEWRPVLGYEGFYEVSNTGRVRSIEHVTKKRKIPSKEIKVAIYKSQRYARVRLYKEGKSKDLLVHRLVAMAFIENPDKKSQINHLDGNRSNNCVDNLEWCTATENQKHAYKHGLKNIEDTVKHTRKAVVQKDLDGNVIKVWESLSAAARGLGLQVANISNCCSGRIKSTGGYKWERFSDV